MPPKRKVAVKKGKPKKAAVPLPPPPPPPPPDPRLLQVEALIPRFGQKLQPPDPSQAYHGYEAEIPTYPEPVPYTYTTCSGITLESPFYQPLNPSSRVYIPASKEAVKVDWQGVRRCWNTLRLYYEPVFGEENYRTPEFRNPVHGIYCFLRQRGEAFAGGFPVDEAKWRPLCELMRMTFYVEGKDPATAVMFARRRDPDSCQSEGLDRLWDGLRAGDLEAVAQAINQEPQLINLPYEDEHVPLTFAAERGDVHMVRLLLAFFAMANLPAAGGETALHLACQQGSLDMVHWLSAYGADPSVQNVFGETPLHYAASRGDEQIVHALCRQCSTSGTTIMPAYKSQATPLHLASARGHVEVVKRLIEYKADVMARDVWGLTPLQAANPERLGGEAAVAMALADPAIVELLEKKKAKKKGGKGGKKRK